MSKPAKVIITIIALLAIVGVYYWQRNKSAQVSEEPIKIGVVLSLTGSAADWGQDELRAVQLAVDETNQAGGINRRKIGLIIEDAPAVENLQKGVSAFQKLVNIDKVNVIIGPTWDDVAQALAPLADASKIVMIAPDSSEGVEKVKDYKYFFSSWLPSSPETLKMTEYMKKNNWLKIGVMRNNDPYSATIKEKLEINSNKLGISIVKDIAITDTGSKDFRSYITLMKSEKIDALFIVFNDEASKCPFLKQASELGFIKPILSTLASESPDSLNKCAQFMEGMKYTYPKKGDKYLGVIKEYKEKYRIDPTSAGTANAYDAANLVIDQFRAGRFTSDAIRAGLLSVRDYSGATGDNISFSPNGYFVLPSADFLIKTVHNNKFEVVE